MGVVGVELFNSTEDIVDVDVVLFSSTATVVVMLFREFREFRELRGVIFSPRIAFIFSMPSDCDRRSIAGGCLRVDGGVVVGAVELFNSTTSALAFASESARLTPIKH